MWKKTKSFAWMGALAVVLLSLGPAASKAYAWDDGPRVAFYGQFGLPHGSVSVYANNGRYYHRPYYRHFYRPSYRPYFYGRSYRPYYRPYRVARVFVYDPFPHWVIRRIDAPAPYCYPY